LVLFYKTPRCVGQKRSWWWGGKANITEGETKRGRGSRKEGILGKEGRAYDLLSSWAAALEKGFFDFGFGRGFWARGEGFFVEEGRGCEGSCCCWYGSTEERNGWGEGS
jgi:hypothetical protein